MSRREDVAYALLAASEARAEALRADVHDTVRGGGDDIRKDLGALRESAAEFLWWLDAAGRALDGGEVAGQ